MQVRAARDAEAVECSLEGNFGIGQLAVADRDGSEPDESIAESQSFYRCIEVVLVFIGGGLESQHVLFIDPPRG